MKKENSQKKNSENYRHHLFSRLSFFVFFLKCKYEACTLHKLFLLYFRIFTFTFLKKKPRYKTFILNKDYFCLNTNLPGVPGCPLLPVNNIKQIASIHNIGKWYGTYNLNYTIHVFICWPKTSLTPSLFLEVPVPNEESERLCICVLDVSIVPLVTIFYWILELLRECRIYVCHFNTCPTLDHAII